MDYPNDDYFFELFNKRLNTEINEITEQYNDSEKRATEKRNSVININEYFKNRYIINQEDRLSTRYKTTSYDGNIEALEKYENNINALLDLIEKTSDNINKLKQIVADFENLYTERLRDVNKLKKTLNNQYLKTGSRLTQLALAKLPKDNKEIEQSILDSIQETDETKRQNIVSNMMASVEDARKGRGGSKKHKHLKRTKTIRRSVKKYY